MPQKSKFGRIDILVNNSGWTGTTPALEVTEEEYDKTMASTLKSVFFACQAAAKIMIPQGRRPDYQYRIEFRGGWLQEALGVCSGQSGSASFVPRALTGMGP